MGPNREVLLAFAAADHDAVRAFHAAAVQLVTESLRAPRLGPEYHAGYFGAFVRDPDGNNVEASATAPERTRSAVGRGVGSPVCRPPRKKEPPLGSCSVTRSHG